MEINSNFPLTFYLNSIAANLIIYSFYGNPEAIFEHVLALLILPSIFSLTFLQNNASFLDFSTIAENKILYYFS